MQYVATGKLLNTARRRLWLQCLIDRIWLSLLLMSGILGLAAILHTFFMPITIAWWGPAALLPLAVSALTAVFNRPSLEEASRAVDRWLNSHDLLTAACHLRSQAAHSASSAVLVVLEQAERVAVKASRSLPRLRKPRHPLPTAMAIAVSAMSLFFLSLQGAASSGRVPAPVAADLQTRQQTAEDTWLPVPDPGLLDVSAVAGDTQTMRAPGSSSFGPSKQAQQQASAATEDYEQGEPGSKPRGTALPAAQAAGTGRVASKQAPAPATDRETAAGDVALTGLELVTLQRKPGGEARAIDHSVSIGLIPNENSYQQPATTANNVTAARAAKEPFSPVVGPAYRALQARYFEETAHND